MPAHKKIHLDKVLASLNAPCPKCGHDITPAGINRVTWDEIKCPKCGLVFDPQAQTLAFLFAFGIRTFEACILRLSE